MYLNSSNVYTLRNRLVYHLLKCSHFYVFFTDNRRFHRLCNDKFLKCLFY